MFKKFTPRVDKQKRLVITRFYAGINGNNTFCYTVSRINKKGELDKKFKPLYAFGTDDFSSVKTFMKQTTGEPVRVVKRPFKVVLSSRSSLFGIEDKSDAKEVWNKVK
jgi:hypothetical protein